MTDFYRRHLRSALSPGRGRLLLQVIATLLILGWVPGNWAKLLVMLAIWGISFVYLAPRELLAMAAVNLVFIVTNSAALKCGIFSFNHPDFLHMPVYEYFMWGFYALHAIRILDGRVGRNRWVTAIFAASVFALPFGIIADPILLFGASASVLLGCLVLFHEQMDLAYAGYMAVLGALIEYTGVWTGQWHYPGRHLGGVPLWFLPMWAGVGLFTRRLVLPLSRSPTHRCS
jgi:hypothetical protein